MSPHLYIFGDPHFSAAHMWRIETGDKFLTWLENFSPEPDSIGIVLGDLSDSALNPGMVVKQLEQFADICSRKFKKTFILKGNHDEKLYQGVPHLSFEFFKLKSNITVLDTPAEVLNIEGYKILSLPFYSYRTDLPPLWDYYANLPDSISSQQYDLVIGHFADTSAPVFEHQVDITYLQTKITALGHIHTRSSAHYVGSLFPCKISEQTGKSRAVWELHKEGDKLKKKEIPLPSFCEYAFIDYPEALPETDPNKVIIWTVNNCDVESVAKEFYKGVHIRGVASAFQRRTDKNKVVSSDDFKISEPIEIFKEWVKESQTLVSRPAHSLIKKLLSVPVSTN